MCQVVHCRKHRAEKMATYREASVIYCLYTHSRQFRAESGHFFVIVMLTTLVSMRTHDEHTAYAALINTASSCLLLSLDALAVGHGRRRNQLEQQLQLLSAPT